MDLSWISDNATSGLSSATLCVAIATALVSVAYYKFKNSGLPPGPTGLPYLGIWPFIQDKEHLQFDKYREKYGDLFSFTCTGTLFINLGSAEVMREACISKSDCFNKRMEMFNYMGDIFDGGALVQQGEEWKIHRKFFLQVLKERVTLSAKDLLSGSLHDSVNSTVDELRGKAGQTVDIVEVLLAKCNANLRLTLFGENGISEDRVKELNELYVGIMHSFVSTMLLLTGNIARYLIYPFIPGYKEAKRCTQKMAEIIYEVIDEHKATFDEDHVRDMIDEYLKEKIARSRKGDPTAEYFTDKGLMGSLIQFVGDGVFSVAALIALFINNLLTYPEEQEKIYSELLEMLGPDRLPTLADKNKLTYANAFIQETLRRAEFVPMFPILECNQETTLSGYRIPKGSVIVLNIYSIHNDPKVYEEPQKFNPSRFVDTKLKSEPIVTFGFGKRACIAESFVMNQVFLFLTTLVKTFRISGPADFTNHYSDIFVERKLSIVLEPRDLAHR